MSPGLCLALSILALLPPADAARRRSTRRRTPARPVTVLPPQASAWDRHVGAAAEAALRGRTGAVVAMDPRNGRVLALVNPDQGLWRAYQPCSVFKIVVALAGLSEGLITPDTRFECTRGCWMWNGHGPIDLRRALAVSCNPYFQRVGERLGYETVKRYARLLGLGDVSGINLTGEVPGVLPNRVPAADVGHLSSHADGIRTTAVQLAALLSAVVNGGVVFQPQVAPAEGFVPRERWRLPAGTVYQGLAQGFLSAVNEGSAQDAFDPDVVVGGKTGTCAHVGWFASYAPADRPELVLVVFVKGGNGHLASRLAGRIYQAIYRPGAGSGGPAAGGR